MNNPYEPIAYLGFCVRIDPNEGEDNDKVMD